jgi:hypothetical protein
MAEHWEGEKVSRGKAAVGSTGLRREQGRSPGAWATKNLTDSVPAHVTAMTVVWTTQQSAKAKGFRGHENDQKCIWETEKHTNSNNDITVNGIKNTLKSNTHTHTEQVNQALVFAVPLSGPKASK